MFPQDSCDEDLDYANDGIITNNNLENVSKVGENGHGFIWSMSEVDHEEAWINSLAPIPESKLMETVFDDVESNTEYDDKIFEKEVEAIFLKGVHENVKVEYIFHEMQSLRLSYNMDIGKCGGAWLYSIMKFALDTLNNFGNSFVKETNDVISHGGNC
ncbi:hypothetical protein Lser_V15G45402 [Lactuca serriola]